MKSGFRFSLRTICFLRFVPPERWNRPRYLPLRRTPRGIPGIGIADIKMQKEVQPEVYEDWVPKEYDPKDY